MSDRITINVVDRAGECQREVVVSVPADTTDARVATFVGYVQAIIGDAVVAPPSTITPTDKSIGLTRTDADAIGEALEAFDADMVKPGGLVERVKRVVGEAVNVLKLRERAEVAERAVAHAHASEQFVAARYLAATAALDEAARLLALPDQPQAAIREGVTTLIQGARSKEAEAMAVSAVEGDCLAPLIDALGEHYDAPGTSAAEVETAIRNLVARYQDRRDEIVARTRELSRARDTIARIRKAQVDGLPTIREVLDQYDDIESVAHLPTF